MASPCFLAFLARTVEFLLRDVEPELQQQRSILHQGALKVLHVRDPARHLLLADAVEQAVPQDGQSPAPEEGTDAPMGRQVPPRAPQERELSLFLGPLPVGPHVDAPGIEPFPHAIDDELAAGLVSAIHQDDHAEGRRPQVELGVEQRRPERRQLLIEGGLRQRLTEFSSFEHARFQEGGVRITP